MATFIIQILKIEQWIIFKFHKIIFMIMVDSNLKVALITECICLIFLSER